MIIQWICLFVFFFQCWIWSGSYWLMLLLLLLLLVDDGWWTDHEEKWRENNNLIENIFHNRSMIVLFKMNMVKLIIHDYRKKMMKKKTMPSNKKIIILTNPLSLIMVPHTQCSIKVSFKIWIIIYVLMQSILLISDERRECVPRMKSDRKMVGVLRLDYVYWGHWFIPFSLMLCIKSDKNDSTLAE